MRVVTRIAYYFFIVLITGSSFFSGMFSVFHSRLFPTKVEQALAGSTAALTAGGNAAVATSAGDNNGFETTPTNTTSSDNAYAVSTNSGSAASTNCALPDTGSDQHDFTTFGVSIPTGAKVTGIAVAIEAKYDSNNGVNTICAFLTWDGGTTWTTGKNTPDIGNADVTNTLGASTDLWGRAGWTATELNNTNFKVRLMTLVANTARDASVDLLTVTVSYNEKPNAPTQDAPANAATGVSQTPTFTMTATDPDANNLGYKVTIYSNSACTTIVQNNDMATSTTGWTGTNATCTAAPTSCYTSGTQGSFLTQTALSASTQYFWHAKAFDPDNSGGVTDSTTCNSFTTAAAGSLTLTASSSQSFNTAIIVQFTSQTSTMSSVGAIKVADTRGGSPGWTLALTGNDWKSGQDVMQLDYDGTGSDGNLGKLCPKPNSGTLYAESGSLVGVSKGTNQCFSSGVTSITILSATSGNGTGTYWLTDMPAEQFFPGSPTVASYTTTIVFTLSMREHAPRHRPNVH